MYLWVLCDNNPSAATACLRNSKTQLYMQSEFMGMVRGVYDGKEGGGFQPGGRAYPLACCCASQLYSAMWRAAH